jgi:sarcosine oxidase
MQPRVAVIGLGVMGAASLWQLARRGVPAIGFEQFEPGHNRGSSHGESRIIRTAYYEDPRYVPLVHRSFDLWRDLEQSSGERLLTMTGALNIGPPDGELVTGTLASVREHGLEHEILDAADLGRRFPQHQTRPGDICIFEEAAGVLLAEPAVWTMVAEAERLGAIVQNGTAVREVQADGQGVRIVTDTGETRVDRAIVSVGPWLGEFLPGLRLPLEVTRQVLAWYPACDPDAFAPAHFPVFFHEVDGHFIYGFPTMDGRTVKMGIHYEGLPTAASTLDRAIRPEDIRPLTDFLATAMNDLILEPERALVCMYTNTPDLHFILDSPAERPELVILGGFSGHGFKFATVIGEAAADLAVKGETRLPIQHFTLDRFRAGM